MLYVVGISDSEPAAMKASTHANVDSAVAHAKRMAMTEGRDISIYKLLETHRYKPSVQEIAVPSYPVITETP